MAVWYRPRMMADDHFLRDVESGTAVFLAPRSVPAARIALLVSPRPLRWRIDEALGTSPLFDLVLGKPTHGHWQQIVAIVTVLGWMTRPVAREVMRSRRASWKRRRSGVL